MTLSLSPVFRARPDSRRAPGFARADPVDLVVEMAHDLRSPLSAILVLAESMLEGTGGPVTESQRHQLGLIYNAALNLCATATDVVEVARGGGQLADPAPAPFVVSELLAAVCDMVRPIAEQKGLRLVMHVPTIDHRVGHTRALSRLLLNLATNAVKYTEHGFVELAARETLGGRIEFSVTDTGPGIEAGEGRREASGMGLGLLICRRLAAAMASELRFESRPTQGTRFYFVLNLPPAAPAA